MQVCVLEFNSQEQKNLGYVDSAEKGPKFRYGFLFFFGGGEGTRTCYMGRENGEKGLSCEVEMRKKSVLFLT